MFEHCTDRVRRMMALANEEAHRLNHDYIGTEHILLGMVCEETGLGARALRKFNVTLDKLRSELGKLVKPGSKPVTKRLLPQTPRARRSIEYAVEESRLLGHDHVGTEHVLLGLLRELDGLAPRALMNMGLSIEQIRLELLHLLSAIPPDQIHEFTVHAVMGESGNESERALASLEQLIAWAKDNQDLNVKHGNYDCAAGWNEAKRQAEALRKTLRSLLEDSSPSGD